MPLPTMVVKNGAGADVTVNNRNSGRQAAVDSQSSVLSTEDLSALTAIATAITALTTKTTSDPATQTTLASVLTKLSSDPATQTTLAQILAKITANAATEATLAALRAANDQLVTLLSTPATQLPPPAPLPAGVDKSGVTVSGAKTVAVANANRVSLSFQNTSDTDMWVSETGTAPAVGVGFKVVAGAAVRISTRAIVQVYCGTAGKTYASTEG